MTLASIDALLAELRQIPLLEPEQIAELTEQMVGQFGDPRALAGELLRRGWLTPFQVNQLLQGRAASLVLGPFVLLERLGEGGMGQVFKARQWKLGRIVALKVIRKERLDNPEAVRRFRREIQAAAQLSHPNIVLAIDADEHEGRHFFAMEYVEGEDLARRVKRHGPMPVEQACDCVRQAALGLQHAFERGLVHRDIKPHNLLLTKQSGIVKVLDMGLARLNVQRGEDYSTTTLTREGTVMGTPDYIAPEQALDARTADIRADLYSLGCTFFFLLTGRAPFAGGNVMEKLLRHQTEPPPSVSSLQPEVPSSIAAIVRRLMAKRPSDRFRTPADLLLALNGAIADGISAAATPTVSAQASDSDTFADLRRESVRSSEKSTSERKRMLLFSAAGIGVLLLLSLLLVLLLRGSGKPPREEETATHSEKANLEAIEKEWNVLRTRAKSPGTDAAKVRDDLLAFRSAHPGTRPALEAAEWFMGLPSPLDRLTAAPLAPEQKLAGQPKELVVVLGDHRSWLGVSYWLRAKYSPNGCWLACTAGDGTVRLLDPADLSVKFVLKGDEPLYGMDFSANGKRIAAAGVGSVVLWDVRRGNPLQMQILKRFPARIGGVAISPNGDTVAIPCETDPPTVRLWTIAGQPSETAVLKGHTRGTICQPAFSPDGKTLVTASQDKTIHVWDLSGREPKERAVLKNHTYWVVSVAFSPDGKLLASSGQHDYTVRLWDMTAAEPKQLTAPNVDAAMNEVAFAPDGKRLAAGFWNRNWRLWDISGRQLNQIASATDHDNINLNVRFAPDGRTLASTCGEDGVVHLWDITQNPPRQRLFGQGHGQRITGMAFAPDDRILASMSADGTVRLWDVDGATARLRSVLPVRAGPVCGAFHPDGRTFVTGDWSSQITYWDVDKGKERRTAAGHENLVQTAAFSPDGKRLASGGADQRLMLWDTESGEWKYTERLDHAIVAVAYSPDGRGLAVADDNGTVQLRYARNGQFRAACIASDKTAAALAYSPDGKRLAGGGKDGRVRLWDAATGRERSSFPGHEKEVCFVAFTADGKKLVSVGRDGRIIVRDSTSGNERQTLQVPLPIRAAALAGDGRHLAIGHVDGTVYLLRLGSEPRR